MQNFLNLDKFKELIQFLNALEEQLPETITAIQNYVDFMEKNHFDSIETGSLEEQLRKTENLLDKFEEIVHIRREVIVEIEKVKEKAGITTEKMNEINGFGDSQEEIDYLHDDLVDKIIELRKELFNDKEVKELEKMYRRRHLNKK